MRKEEEWVVSGEVLLMVLKNQRTGCKWQKESRIVLGVWVERLGGELCQLLKWRHSQLGRS